MKFVCIILAAAFAQAAEPDWKRLEKDGLDFLQQYIRVQSVNPPADTRAAANLVKGLLERHGIPVRLLPSGPEGQVNLLARLPGRDRSKKPVLLLNHLDVVPVDRKAWGSIDPFAAEIRDGDIWGRGTMDI
jgi:acetylornithine deacetylase/succinyl-diaminopimelate desuccinylase-like protein